MPDKNDLRGQADTIIEHWLSCKEDQRTAALGILATLPGIPAALVALYVEDTLGTYHGQAARREWCMAIATAAGVAE